MSSASEGRDILIFLSFYFSLKWTWFGVITYKKITPLIYYGVIKFTIVMMSPCLSLLDSLSGAECHDLLWPDSARTGVQAVRAYGKAAMSSDLLLWSSPYACPQGRSHCPGYEADSLQDSRVKGQWIRPFRPMRSTDSEIFFYGSYRGWRPPSDRSGSSG